MAFRSSRILHPDLVDEYYKSIKENYPNITKEQVNEICSAPFLEVRSNIESGEFKNVRLQFFGSFICYPKKVRYMLEKIKEAFNEQRITPAEYFKKKELLEIALERKVNKDTKKRRNDKQE